MLMGLAILDNFQVERARKKKNKEREQNQRMQESNGNMIDYQTVVSPVG